jgi:hypothetical protein
MGCGGWDSRYNGQGIVTWAFPKKSVEAIHPLPEGQKKVVFKH